MVWHSEEVSNVWIENACRNSVESVQDLLDEARGEVAILAGKTSARGMDLS